MSKTMKTGALAASVLALVGCTAAAGTGSPESTAASTGSTVVSCAIEETKSSGGVVLQAVAESRQAIDGSYRFEVAKRGGGGTSNSAQSGDFTLRAGESVVLSEIALGGGGGLSYDAELTLTWDDGEVSCKAE